MRKLLITLMTFTMLGSGLAQATDPLIRLDLTIQEQGEPVEVKVNLPISLIESMIPNIQQGLNSIEIDDNNLDLRAIWNEVRAAGPNEFVRVNGDEANVSVRTDDTFLYVNMEHATDGTVNITIPLALGDLIFDQVEIDPQAIIDELRNWTGDLVTITGSKVSGRVWIE